MYAYFWGAVKLDTGGTLYVNGWVGNSGVAWEVTDDGAIAGSSSCGCCSRYSWIGVFTCAKVLSDCFTGCLGAGESFWYVCDNDDVLGGLFITGDWIGGRDFCGWGVCKAPSEVLIFFWACSVALGSSLF